MLKTDNLRLSRIRLFVSGLIILELFKTILFYVVLSFFNLTYKGCNDSNIYVIIMISIFFVSFSIYVLCELNNFNNLFRFIKISFIISLVLFLGAFQIIRNYGFDYSMMKYFFFFWIFSFNSILWGNLVGREIKKFLPLIIKWVEVVTLLVAMSSVITILIPVLSGSKTIVYAGGTNSQTASYLSAFAFGLTLFYFIRGYDINRFKMFNAKSYKPVSGVLLFCLIFSTIAPGGRGAFVLLISYIIFGLWYFLKKKQVSTFRTGYVILALILLLTLVILSNKIYNSNKMLRDGFHRALAFIDFENMCIDMEGGSSGRGGIYLQAIKLIGLKPVFGYGLFEYMYHLTSINQYPHNFILEILLQGGFVYLLIVASIFIFGVYKLRKMVKANIEYEFLVFLVLYPMVLLTFSGTYLNQPIFLFCLTIILSADVSSYEKTSE